MSTQAIDTGAPEITGDSFQVGINPLALRQRRNLTFIVVGVAILLNLITVGDPTLLERVYATLVLGLAFLPTYWWLGTRETTFPFFPLVSAVYALYLVPQVFVDREYYILGSGEGVADHYVEQALLMGILGLGAMFIGHFVPRRSWLDKHLPRLNMIWEDHPSLEFIAIILGGVGLVAYYLKLRSALPVAFQQVGLMLADLSVISMCILYARYLNGKLTFQGKLVLVGTLGVKVAFGFGSGHTYQGLEPLLFLTVVYATVRRRLPVTVMGIGCLLLVITIPLRVELRERTWAGVDADLSPLAKAGLFFDIFEEFLDGKGMSYSEASMVSVRRMSHLGALSVVIRLTPEIVPYWAGQTYLPLFTKPIPRFLWPDKPTEVTGQEFGHRYRLLGSGDQETSFNLPILIEWYANFGVAGIGLGMMFLGLFYRALQHLFTHATAGIGGVVGGAYMMARQISLESSFSMVFGGYIWAFLLLVIVNRFMEVGRTGGTREALE